MFVNLDQYFKMLFSSNILTMVVGILILLPVLLLFWLLMMKGVDKHRKKQEKSKETEVRKEQGNSKKTEARKTKETEA